MIEALPSTHWTDEALCTEVGGDIFFVAKSGSSLPAKMICAQCPVSQICLQEQLERESADANAHGAYTKGSIIGIYGGKTPRERKRILKQWQK